MPSRLSSCDGCHRALRRCICEHLCCPKLDTPFSFLLLQSEREANHVKNSGALFAESLLRAERVTLTMPSHHDQSQEDDQRLSEDLSQALPAEYALLYPLNGSEPSLSWREFYQQPDPTLIIIDTDWGQSRRLVERIPILSKAPRIQLPQELLASLAQEGKRSYQSLRTVKQQDQIRCSTLEAGIAAAAWYHHLIEGERLSVAWTHYQTLWEAYEQWLDELSARFKRR